MDFSMFENMKLENNFMNQSSVNSTKSNTNYSGKFPEHTPLAMAYVPFQQWSDTCELSEAFSCGTIFSELNLPFKAEEDCYGQR